MLLFQATKQSLTLDRFNKCISCVTFFVVLHAFLMRSLMSLTFSRHQVLYNILLFGDSKLPAIDNNLILKASIKYIMTKNRFSVPLF